MLLRVCCIAFTNAIYPYLEWGADRFRAEEDDAFIRLFQFVIGTPQMISVVSTTPEIVWRGDEGRTCLASPRFLSSLDIPSEAKSAFGNNEVVRFKIETIVSIPYDQNPAPLNIETTKRTGNNPSNRSPPLPSAHPQQLCIQSRSMSLNMAGLPKSWSWEHERTHWQIVFQISASLGLKVFDTY